MPTTVPTELRAPSATEALGMPVPPAPVARAGMRLRRLLGRAHDAMVPPPQLLLERVFGLLDTKALSCAVELRLPELLADGPRSAAELAEAAGADPGAVARVLRYLVSRGFFTTGRHDRFANNGASDVLRSDHPHSWRAWVAFFGSDWNSRIFDQMAQRMRSGTPATESRVRALRAQADQLLAAAGVADRAAFAAGDFFASVPFGCDLATMFAVLHDWDDDSCAKILRHTAGALEPGGRILVVEKPLPTHDGADFAKASDLVMLVLGHGGRERTVAQYEDLFTRAGLRLRSRTTLPSLFTVFELAAGDATGLRT